MLARPLALPFLVRAPLCLTLLALGWSGCVDQFGCRAVVLL
jgi:hypothetical protein